ncbi:MAG TPA: heparan-alpha-glucosaminide N-acetyltransferase domain-containing protein, partial [Pseudonocardiaceae bacterium]|nr:heparan-alpha-glucosaminide N-acetyltransferase domain-containing protein [Pseudonocardiaceae bacterium]
MPADRPGRVIGVDVARGIALIGMMAVHVFATFDSRGDPTIATEVAAGRSAITFVLVAGVSLAFLSGGQRPVQGRTRTAAAAGIAVRALLIGMIGLSLGYTTGATKIEVILPYYAVLFLLAIPLLGLRPRTLALISAGLIAVVPVVIFAVVDAQGRSFRESNNPTFGHIAHDPSGLIVGIFVTGPYPVLAYLAYLCAGLALGRLDLSSRRVAAWLLGGGLGLALTARIVSAVLLFPLGGLRQLRGDGSSSPASLATNVLLWDAKPNSSWWYLALPAPHSLTPIDMIHTLGSAMAVLGAALLLMRVPVVARLLRPLAAVGTMTLTLYCGHVLVLAPGLPDDTPGTTFFLMV